MTDPRLRDLLLRFELALATRDPAGIEGGLMSLIADDFVEFGSSGRIWTRDSIRAVLEGAHSATVSVVEAQDRFEVTELAEGVALVTYRGPKVNRASIWVRRDDRWRIRFHQGTAVPSGGPEHPGDQAAGEERQPE